MREEEIIKDEFGEFRYTDGCSIGGREETLTCFRCRRVYNGKRKVYKQNYCSECEKILAEDAEMKRRNKEYKKTHKWSRREPQITANLQIAKAKGMSYGQYVAMKNAGWI
jgi:RNA polymerase subunit RPABC4/transcription elongation factor Spt4